MTEKRGRVIINAVLILAVLAFIGVSMVPLLEGAVKQGQSSNVAASPRASTDAKQSELESQARGYELVLQREPENQTALRGLIDTRVQLSRLRLNQNDREGSRNDLKAVIEPLEKLTKLNPEETRFGVLLAQAKQYLGDREGAAQAYRTILNEKPGELTALQGLVALLIEQQRPEAAIGLLQDTLKDAPKANQIKPNSVDTASVQLLLGQVYAEQKRYDEAIAIYDEASKANASDFRPVLAKALILKEQGKTEAAKTLFTTASSLAPAEYRDQIKQMAEQSAIASPTPKPAGGADKKPADSATDPAATAKPEKSPNPDASPAPSPTVPPAPAQ